MTKDLHLRISYNFSLSIKNGCRKATDVADGIIINKIKYNFTAPHAVSCPDLDQPYPRLPGLGQPEYSDDILKFALPWGSDVYVDFDQITVTSPDFSKIFPIDNDLESL